MKHYPASNRFCLYCGKRLSHAKMGRKRLYCDKRHKDKAYRARVRHLLAGIRP